MRFYEIAEKEIKIDMSSIMNDDIEYIFDIFKRSGFELRLVGGAPRDLVLGKTPKDLDFSTTATPKQMMKIAHDNNIKVIETGLQHGTLTFLGPKTREPYEITTLRIDTEHTGRHATVKFTKNWKKDAARRDLTFNSMSIGQDGTLYDYFGGIEDLKKGRAHFVGDADARIQEDYLRILRYFRFKGRLSQPDFDQHTLDAIERNAKGLEQISGERIWMEISKILAGNHTKLLLDAISETGVDLYINLPPLATDNLDRIKENTDNPVTILGGMLQKESQVNELDAKWKFSSDESELMRFIVKQKYEAFDEGIAKEMWTNKKIPNSHVLELAKYFGRKDIVSALGGWKTPKFPITGNDLIALGIKPGPDMGNTLRWLETKWKESNYELDKDELIRMIPS